MIHTMTRKTTLPIAATLAMLVLFACSAAAQTVAPMPALKAKVVVSSDIVRIGDLVENAGPVADVPIFRAPDLGTTGAVTTDRIVDAISQHQLIGIDTRGLAEVLVTRASRAIPAQEISARIAQALSGQNGLGDAHNIYVTFDHEVRTLEVEPNATGELQVVALSYEPRTSRFDITLDLPASAALRRQSARFTGTAIETVDDVAVTHPVEHGEVLKASDLTTVRRPKSEGTALTDPATVVGLSARHQLRPGQPLYAADLMKPEIVQRNDTVTIVYEAPGITLTLRGKAQDSGALGDTISVTNIESKRVVQGTISGPDRVNVGAVTTRVVDSGAQKPE
jgi:flagellar basal body P-ring formation protein FlgA